MGGKKDLVNEEYSYQWEASVDVFACKVEERWEKKREKKMTCT